MIFSPNDIYNIIDKNNFRSVRIYEGFIDDFKNNLPLDQNTFSTKGQLIERLKDYENLYDGKFTFLLGQGLKNEQIRHMKKHKVEYYKQYIQQPNEDSNSLNFVRADEIDRKVNLLLAEKIKEMEKQKEIEEMKNKLTELDTLSGKLNYFLTQFVDSYIQKMTMNGNTMNGFTQYNKQPQTMTAVNQNTLEESLATLIDFIGEENIIKFSTKIKSGQADHVKPIIINFINN